MNIVLAGMPGSGKTTVAKALSATYGMRAVDTDEEIVKKYGSINYIFAEYGEKRFRDIETETVKELSALKDTVIATGGGCLLRAENVEYLKKNGRIVYLKTQPETLIRRVEGNFDRPLLLGGAAERITRLYKERKPVYEAAADFTLDTEGLTPQEIAGRIMEIVK